MEINKVYLGDSLEVLKGFPDESIDCCVTSPPYYGLRDYGVVGQIGLEESPEQYIEKLILLFREVRRVLKKNGTCWVNLGDSYWGGGWRNAEFNKNSGDIQKGSMGTHCGLSMPNLKGTRGVYKDKDLIGIPWMFAFAMRADGWYLRQDIIWAKPNPMPESVTDRCTKSHEYIFLFSKCKKYYFDYKAIQEATSTQDLSGAPKSEGNKYGENEDAGFQTYLGDEHKFRTKNCSYDGQRPNSMHLRREMGMKDEDYIARNKRDVWTVNVSPTREAHFATYPQKLIMPCILAGCAEGGIILDPFMGSGTTGIVARRLNRNFVGVELNPQYRDMAERRIFNEGENLFNQDGDE